VTFQNLFWDVRTGLLPWADGQTANVPHQQTVGDVSQFHLYTIEWDASQIRWYVDRETNPTPVHVIDITPSNMEEFRKPFHIILNLAISGQFTNFAEPNPAQFPTTMQVDYVRVWQRQERPVAVQNTATPNGCAMAAVGPLIERRGATSPSAPTGNTATRSASWSVT